MKNKNTRIKRLIKLFILTITGAALFGLSIDLGIVTLGVIGGVLFLLSLCALAIYATDDDIFD